MVKSYGNPREGGGGRWPTKKRNIDIGILNIWGRGNPIEKIKKFKT